MNVQNKGPVQLVLSAVTTEASTSEVHDIETLIDERVTRRKPKRLMYNKAADADGLRVRK